MLKGINWTRWRSVAWLTGLCSLASYPAWWPGLLMGLGFCGACIGFCEFCEWLVRQNNRRSS